MARIEPSNTNLSLMSFLPSRNFCFPALVYFLMAIIGAVASIGEVSAISFIIKLIFIFLWTWFLNYLCETGYSSISWFLVFLPFVLFILMFFLALEMMSYSMSNQINVAPNLEPTSAALYQTTFGK